MEQVEDLDISSYRNLNLLLFFKGKNTDCSRKRAPRSFQSNAGLADREEVLKIILSSMVPPFSEHPERPYIFP